jgi:hypothetical protein
MTTSSLGFNHINRSLTTGGMVLMGFVNIGSYGCILLAEPLKAEQQSAHDPRPAVFVYRVRSPHSC